MLRAEPAVLRWARERAGLSPQELAKRLGWRTADRILTWETTGEITLQHLERLAEKTYTPAGYLFLAAPPVEKLPIPDFRTFAGESDRRPSPGLIETILQAQQSQDWFREYLLQQGAESLPFVGSVTVKAKPGLVGGAIRDAIDFESSRRREFPTWEDALKAMIDHAEAIGVLVMRSGVVGDNTHRKLDEMEFRGFALSDPLAPLVFVNGADAKSAQMFTIAHELAHVWLGVTGVSGLNLDRPADVERFCNAVAAEVMAPIQDVQSDWNRNAEPYREVQRLARTFRTSVVTMLITAYQAGIIERTTFDDLMAAERRRDSVRPAKGGGDYYRTKGARLGKRFSRAVVGSALEGCILLREALQLLGVQSADTFNELAKSLGVAA